MARFGTAWAALGGCLLGVSLVGCTASSGIESHVQQVRTNGASQHQTGFMGFDIFATDPSGNAMMCGEGELTVAVSVSTETIEGPYVPIPEDELEITCSEPSHGEVSIVIDNSGSEDGFIDTLRDAATELVTAVQDAGGESSLVRISTRAHVVTELTDSVDDAVAGIESLWIKNGWTALWDGIRLGGETMGGQVVDPEPIEFDDVESFCSSARRSAVVAYTDGRDNNSAEEHPCETCKTPNDGIDTNSGDLGNLRIEGTTIPVYTVGVGDEPAHDDLEAIAEASGGVHFAVEDHDALAELLPKFAGYVAETHSVCFELPESECEPIFVKIEYTWEIDGETIEQTSIQEVHPCPTLDPVCGWSIDDELHSLIGWFKVDMNGEAEVKAAEPEDASVRSNGQITLKGNAVIDGNATTADVVKIVGNAEVTGEIVEGAPIISLLSATEAVAAAALQNDNESIPLTQNGVNPVEEGPSLKVAANDTLVLPAGVYYFTDLDIVGGASLEVDGEVKIYLDGKAKLAGNTTTNSQDPRDLILISSSDEVVQLVGTSVAHMGVYAPEAAVVVTGTQQVTGAIAAKSVTVNGTAAAIVHDQALDGLCAVPQ